MVAGLNLSARLWRFVSIDDDIGGNVPSGTVIYENINARKIEHPIARLDLLDQGLETERQNLFMLYPSTLDIRENDELEITGPPNHPEYKSVFRVHTQPQREGYHPSDPRGYIIVSAKRKVVSHAIQ
jgi:hypothetical protein